MQGPPQDGVRAIIEWLEGRDMSVLTRRTLLVHRVSGSFGGGPWAAAVFCQVEWCSAAFNVRENCSRNSSEGTSGESKNWPGKISDEPNTG